MPSPTDEKTLPSREELDAASRDLTEGFNSIERAVFRISNVGKAWEEESADERGDEVPGLEQMIGAVFSFKAGLER